MTAGGIIRHPVTAVIITSAVAVVLYWLARKEIEPRFYATEATLLAETARDEPSLRILWNNEPVPNIRSCKVVIWNAGRQFLDSANVAPSNPITVNLIGATKILRVRVLRASRPTLHFGVQIVPTPRADLQQITLRFTDEALEERDGVMLHVLFTGQENTRVTVSGRIKGAPQGFVEDSRPKLRLSEQGHKLAWPIGIMAVISCLAGVVNLYHGIQLFSQEDRKRCWFCLISGAAMLVVTVGIAYYLVTAFWRGLPWV